LGTTGGKIVLFIVNEAYFFMTHRIAVANALAEAGCKVHVAVPADHVWAPEGFSIKEIEEAGFSLHIVPLSRRGKNILQDARTFLSIYRLVRNLRPDIVHLFTIKPVIYGGLAARLAGVKALISTFTGLGHVFIARGMANRLVQLAVIMLYRLGTGHPNSRVIVQNKGDAGILIRKGAVREEKVRLIPGSGVDLGLFPLTIEPQGTPLVILPSRLIWDKGIAEFVHAARALREGGIPCRFALIGDTQSSNPRAVPERQIRKWVEEGCLEWWGRRTDMPAVFAQAAIVCLPTTYGEGLPKVLIEAAASGRAIITTDIAACREVVRQGENGILVPPGDEEALLLALNDLLTSPEKRRKMGVRGREIVAQSLTEDHVVGATLDVYREISGLP
jgi:glycosyltransferase involved in cell wall biosynthesis